MLYQHVAVCRLELAGPANLYGHVSHLLRLACRLAFSKRLGKLLVAWVWEDGHNVQTQFFFSPSCVQIMELLVLMIILHWRKILLILAVALVFGTVRDALSEPLVGRASVIDGDSIEIHGERMTSVRVSPVV